MVDALKFNEGYSMVAAPVLDECRRYLVDFGRFTIQHCIRESNYVAHELARWDVLIIHLVGLIPRLISL